MLRRAYKGQWFSLNVGDYYPGALKNSSKENETLLNITDRPIRRRSLYPIYSLSKNTL